MPTYLYNITRNRQAQKRYTFCKCITILTVSSIFVIEIIRKFFIQSIYTLVFYDIIILLISIPILFFNIRDRVVNYTIIWMMAFLFWGGFTVFFGHKNIYIYYVGLRPLLLPALIFIVAYHIYKKCGINYINKILFLNLLFVFLLINSFALLQIYLGKSHPINYINSNLSDEHMGIGDYTVNGRGLDWLFRPTSIFLHTGKYGQINYIIVVFIIYYIYMSKKYNIYTKLLFIIISLFSIILTGQRASFLFFSIYIVILNALYYSRLFYIYLFIIFFSLILIYLFFNKLFFNYSIFFERMYSGFLDVPHRVYDNLILPIKEVIAYAGALGVGMGLHSLGATNFGGEPLYIIINQGTAENSWLRIYAETGIFGLIVYAFAIYFITLSNNKNLSKTYNYKLYRKTIIYITISLLLWGITHDIIGNFATMSIYSFYLAPLFLFRYNKCCSVLQSKVRRQNP